MKEEGRKEIEKEVEKMNQHSQKSGIFTLAILIDELLVNSRTLDRHKLQTKPILTSHKTKYFSFLAIKVEMVS